MEELQTPQKMIRLIQKSGTYNYKMLIPVEVEKKIRFVCQQIWDTEWSGVLFFTYNGTFEDNNLVIECKDIYIMDIGMQCYTEFDMNPSVIAYMTEHPELLDCQLGLIHSHNNMSTFFSQTDISTLREEGKDRNNFVSLIVNNAGTYTAAITRMIHIKQIKEIISYNFFNAGEKTSTLDCANSIDEIEWFYLKIEKDNEIPSFSDINTRLNEIKQQKEKIAEKAKVAIPQHANSSFDIESAKVDSINTNKNIFMGKHAQQEIPFDSVKEDELEESESNYIIPYKHVSINSKTIKSLIKQLVTCSTIISNENKIDINKWIKNISIIYEKRFGRGDNGIRKFQEWAESYVEFLTWNVEDEYLSTMGFSRADIQSICAYDLIKELTKFPKNTYIKLYIDELKKYLL